MLETEEDLVAWVLKGDPIRDHAELCNVIEMLCKVGLARPTKYRYGDWQETAYVNFILDITIQQSYHDDVDPKRHVLVTRNGLITDVKYNCAGSRWKTMKQYLP